MGLVRHRAFCALPECPLGERLFVSDGLGSAPITGCLMFLHEAAYFVGSAFCESILYAVLR